MKKNMPLEGLRWSRDSGSALYDTPQTAVLGRAGGGILLNGFLKTLMSKKWSSMLRLPIQDQQAVFRGSEDARI